MRRSMVGMSVAALLLALAAIPARAAVTGAWAVNDGEKIFRYDENHPSRAANSLWDGKTIRLTGLYNEVLAFQVMVEADSFGAKGVEVAVVPPLHAKSGKAIGAEEPALYGPGGSIELFSQHYLNITRPTKPLWFYGSAASAPKRMTGWIPDALIPAEARVGQGGFPLEIPRAYRQVRRHQDELEVIPTPSRQNQGFWVDLYLPRDRAYPAGLYQGKVIVRAEGKTVAELPLEVTLVPHYLPDENHSNIWLYGSVGVTAQYFPGLSREEVDRMLKFESHRHRVDFIGGSAAHGAVFDEAMMADYLPWLDGSGFTPANGYQGPGQGQGEKLFTVGIYGSITGRAFADRESAWRESDRWVTWFEKNAPNVTYFWYMIDEPGEVQFPWIKERAGWVHGNPGPGKKLPVFTTRSYTEALKDDIDLWAGHNGVDLAMMPRLKAAGKDHWFYNGHRPRYGAVITEADAVDFRVNAWVKYIHQVSTWFLWEGTHWRHNMQGPKGHLHQRVFSEPLTFLNWGDNGANGDGIVFYPGRMPFYPEEDRGLDRLLPSIRLKNMRRGQQDFELMWLAEQKVGREKVLELVKQAVPRSLEAEVKTDSVAWSEHGDDYDRVRLELIRLLGK